MEYKEFPTYTKQVDGRTADGLAAITGIVDDGSDLLWKGAFAKTLKEGAGRVRHLWRHDYSQPPTAAIKDIREVGRGDLPKDLKDKYPDAKGGLLVSREYLDTPRGNEVLAGIKAGAITEMSFGYDPIKFDFEEVKAADGTMLVRNLREVRLWDTSDVVWGMNQAALASKVAMPYRDTGTADAGTAWSKPKMADFTDAQWADLSAAEKKRIASHYAWSASSPAEKFDDLKLPHHQASGTGVGPAVWRGVAAAMAALMGGRGGINIPDSERRAVYNHLAKHYKQFDKEPPEFKLIDLALDVAAALPLLGDGMAWEPVRNWRKMAETLCELRELLEAEPPARALTPWATLTRLAIAERELTQHLEV